MRVAYNAILLGNYFSGVEVTISTLGEMLSHTLAHDLHIFLNKNIENRYTFPNAELHPVNISQKYRSLRIIWEHFKLPGEVKKLKCDLLHCPGYIAPYKAPCPTVITVHDIIAFKHPELCKTSNRLYFRAMLARSIRQAAQIIVPSNFVKNNLIESFNTASDKINVIPFAAADVFKRVDDPEQLIQVRKKYKLPEKFILFLGNHEPKKNIEGIIRAFAKFKKQVKGYKLVLAGRTAWRTARIHKLIEELTIEKDIICTGYVPIADLLALYSLADIFFFPSLDEGFGIPVIEAMSCGTPVICSNSGALPETTAGAAICLPPDNYNLMAEKLANFANSPALRAEYAEKGLKRIEQLSWKTTTEATLKVYKKALQ